MSATNLKYNKNLNCHCLYLTYPDALVFCALELDHSWFVPFIKLKVMVLDRGRMIMTHSWSHFNKHIDTRLKMWNVIVTSSSSPSSQGWPSHVSFVHSRDNVVVIIVSKLPWRKKHTKETLNENHYVHICFMFNIIKWQKMMILIT